MAVSELGIGENIVGRELSGIEKYGNLGCGYFGKVLMSSGERPVLGSKVLVDLAEPHLVDKDSADNSLDQIVLGHQALSFGFGDPRLVIIGNT